MSGRPIHRPVHVRCIDGKAGDQGLSRRQVRLWLAGLTTTFALGLGTLSFAATAKADITLNVDPVIESQPGRSWAAVGEMVMRYYSAPNTGPNDDYQCGIANFLTGQRMSEDCAAPAKMTALQATQKVIADYLTYAYKFFDEDPRNMAFQQGKVLPPDELIHELEFERPIVVAIEPPKMSDADKDTKEVALIVGYQGTADGLQVIVNDPRSYAVGANPYIDAGGKQLDTGQYQLPYQDFLKEMRWTVSIYRIKPQ
ncbi:MAG TPA: hypothetical protein VM639_19430 [Dongiaceae bacterium]|nr:hypothetical protein [Dongiaceae bacterium]